MSDLRGLYAITSHAICADESRLLAAVAAALRGGAALIQYRDKEATPDEREHRAHRLLELCRAQRRPLIVNDDPALAAHVGADGVHLGQSDAALATARALLGPRAIIGVTCGASLERARAAADGGASYVAFGRFFASRTKPDAPPVSIEILDQAKTALALPVCAIGGITPALAPQLIARGARLVAAIDGVFGGEDVEARAQAYSALFG
jgi:thiamine-phosphate pyrophosphorylase